MNLTKVKKEKRKELKIARRIYPPKKIAEGEYRKLNNLEIQIILQEMDVMKTINLQRL